MKTHNKSNKAQTWGIDLVIAMTIFSIAIIIFFLYSINFAGYETTEFKSLDYDAEIIADSILSPGSPENWTTDSVVIPGILTNNQINQTKLDNLKTLTSTQENYQTTRLKFSTKYDFYFFLKDSPNNGIGKPNTDPETIADEKENLVKITRFTIYENKPKTVYLYLWD